MSILSKIICLGVGKLENIRWGSVYQGYRERYKIAKTFRFNGNNISLAGDGRIVLGENSYIGESASISATKGFEVVIGRKCSISSHVTMMTTQYKVDLNLGETARESVSASIHVGNNCWIGVGVFIKQGVNIGDNVVVGANSVVTRDVQNDCVVAGCPARLLKTKTLSD